MAKDYVVKDGDCIGSIGFAHGFYWKTLWDDPSNAKLKNKRNDPNILKSGDVLHIPDLKSKAESGAAEQRHTFKVKGIPAMLRLRVMDLLKPDTTAADEEGSKEDESSVEDPDYDPKPIAEEPLKNCPFILEIDGTLSNGTTDGEGKVEVPLPPHASKGRLIFKAGTPEERVIPLDLGAMDPITEMTGVRKRLLNLGIPCKPAGDTMTPDLEAALLRFQEASSLDMTGKLDDTTRDKLKEVHGS